MSEVLFAEARVRILEDIQALKTKSIDQLRMLVKNPTKEKLMLGQMPIYDRAPSRHHPPPVG